MKNTYRSWIGREDKGNELNSWKITPFGNTYNLDTSKVKSNDVKSMKRFENGALLTKYEYQQAEWD